MAETDLPEEIASRTLPRLKPGPRAASFDWMSAADELRGTTQPFAEAEEAPALEAARPATEIRLGPYVLTRSGQRIEVRADTLLRWVVDAAAFGGTPQVTLAEEDGAALVRLRGAFYPGTTIPADLEARLFDADGKGSWQIRLRLKLGAFDATVPLQPWLNGTAPAVSIAVLDLVCCPLGPASELAARGAAIAAFRPDWVLGLFGADVFQLAGFSGDVRPDTALVVPLPAGAPQVLLSPALRRTVLLFSSDRQFPLTPELSTAWPRFDRGAFRFDGLALEAGLDAAGVATRELFAQSTDDPERLGFAPAADLRGSDGAPFRLRLANPRYAVVFDGARTRRLSAFFATVDETRLWLHAPGASLFITRSSRSASLAAIDLADGTVAVQCRAHVLQTALRVPDLLVRPVPAPRRMDLTFSWGPPASPGEAGDGHLDIDPATGASVLRLPPGLFLEVVRRDDFLVLGYGFLNLRFEAAGEERRFLPAGNEAAHLLVELPPQSVGEEAFFEEATGFPPDQTNAPKAPPPPTKPGRPPVKALLAQPSRLVFTVPAAASPLALSSRRLLTWLDLPPSLAPTALPGRGVLVRRDDLPPVQLAEHPLAAEVRAVRRVRASAARTVSRNLRPDAIVRVPLEIPLEPAEPTLTTTAIEAPFRMILSPNRFGAWAHALQPVTHGGRTELWHTRLGVRQQDGARVDEVETRLRTVRAIWARDFQTTIPEGQPFLMPLSQDDRRILVRLTSDFSIAPPPLPVGVNRLMLSALGAWLDTEVRFPKPPSDLPIEEWQHRATLGRDHFVKVVYPGHLYNLGHRASVVKITERKVQPSPDGHPVAYLRQIIFVIVKEPERTYDGPGYAAGGREFPWKRVRIVTPKTPNLDDPKNTPLGALVATAPLAKFWPHVLGQPFRFHVKAWDWEGREHDFTIPLAFVRTDQDDTPEKLGQVLKDYKDADPALRSAPFGGQGVAYAETDAASLGKTRLETNAVLLTALAPVPPRSDPHDTPCYPALENAKVSLPALRQVAGSDGTATITLEPYVTLSFGAGNPAKLFAHVEGAALDYAGKADRAGGVATPNLQIRGLSRELGAVGDDGPDLRAGTFDPAAFFQGAAPKLLGGLRLVDILEKAQGAEFLAKAPKLVTENHEDLIRTRIDWSTDKLKPAPGFVPDAGAALALSSVLVTRKNGGGTEMTLTGALTHFRLSLAGVIEVSFRTFSFRSENGKKPDFHVEVTGLEFTGDLEFVNALREVMGTDHFTDPPFLDIAPQGLAIGYTLTIPSVSVGVVGLSNLALGARLSLPFTGEPARLRFNISERHSPFIVSVGPFGGGGFFALVVGVDGLEVLEASVEFGGSLSIDLGVASGGVYVLAGIYFRIRLATPANSELTGYVRLGGSLSVLGIISVSIEFYLGLSYGDGKAWGEARVTVSIHVLLFSADVSVSCRQQFAGSKGDPPFGEVMPLPQWQAYCAAFA